MRRRLFYWSISILGGLFLVGCAHQECRRCGQPVSREHVLGSRGERPTLRTVKMPARPNRANPVGEEVTILNQEHSPSTVGTPIAAPAPSAPPATLESPVSPSIDNSPNLPPIRLPFDASKQNQPANPAGNLGLPPIIDQVGANQATHERVRNGFATPSSPDVPLTAASDTASDTAKTPSDRTGIPTSGNGLAEPTNASVKLGAVEDYKSLTGHVTSFRKSWRLRYAAVENEDLHGGSVMLNGAGLDCLKDGQLVRVQGTILAPADRNQPAMFQVQAIEILAPGN
ncbi:MAG: hypothetical protein K2X38_22360 [Gemmataceae bacterium]|nr:hypothetical protein [Gemmataceae bacterium]